MRQCIKILAAGICLLAGCKEDEQRTAEPKSPNCEYAAQMGKIDADKAADASSNRMNLDKMLIDIRIKEEKILAAGDTAAARAYILAAEKQLKARGILH